MHQIRRNQDRVECQLVSCHRSNFRQCKYSFVHPMANWHSQHRNESKIDIVSSIVKGFVKLYTHFWQN